MLNPESPLPLYRQLADLLADRIRRGDYPPGDRLPAETRLARDFRIGRPTVRQALDNLVRGGLLERRRGAGTFVRPPRAEVDLFSLAGTLSAFQERGLDLTTRLLRSVRLVRVPRGGANPFAGTRAYQLERLSLVDGEPVLLEALWLHAEIFRGLEREDLAGRSLSGVVAERYGLRPCGGRQTFRIGTLGGARGAALAVTPETPVLVVERRLDFPRAPGAIYAELFCRTDRFVYAQSLGGAPHG
jgi:GntR family transcriptional regulator